MFENPRRGRQARNFTTSGPKMLVLKLSSEQIFSRKLPLGAPDRNHQQKHHIFVRLELENSVLLHLVLLRFTPVASNSFSFPSFRSSYTATLSSTRFWIFLPRIEFNRAKKPMLEDCALITFHFTLPVFRTEQGPWHKWIQPMKGFHFPSTRTTNSVRLILSTHSLRKHPFLLALRRWGRLARRNVCDSVAKTPYWWRKSMFT